MRRSLTLAVLGAGTVVGAALPALAQTADGEWRADIEITVAGSAVDDETPLAPAADNAMASALLSVTRSDTFENGLTLGWRGAVRYERDAPSRPAFTGVLGACPATNAACPRRPCRWKDLGGRAFWASIQGRRRAWTRGRRRCSGGCRLSRRGLIRQGLASPAPVMM